MIDKIINYLKGKNIAILGFGMEGIATYHFIRRYSKMLLTIIDKVNPLDKVPELAKDENVMIVYGDDYLNGLEEYDLVIKSPGVITKDIDVSNIHFTSELELLLKCHRHHTIGITATKGKSTTSTLTYEVLKSCGVDTILLGNIGKAIFDEIEKIQPTTWVVVEMSALQLEFVDVSPHIAAIINLYEDHLDHAGTVEHYHANKLNIFKYQHEDDYAIYSSDISPLCDYIDERYKAIKYGIQFNETNENNIVCLKNHKVYLNNNFLYNSLDERKLLGEHNLRNIMFVLTIAYLLKLDSQKIITTINNFKGLEHRIEYVGKYHDIIFYNDAIATIPDATINAIEALKNVDTLIFGGMDRGINYQELIDFLNKGIVRNLICMPTTGYKVGSMITNNKVNIYKCEMLKDAVKLAKEITNKDKICLLSPAASSYEYFKNFEEKGKAFKEFVKEED